MPTLVNGFQIGQPSGTTLTAANSDDSTAGNAVNAVTFSGGNAMTVDSTHPAHGTLGLKIAIAAAAGAPAYVEWSTSLITGTTSGVVYGRSYVYLEALAGASFALLRGLEGTVQRWRISITSDGRVEFRNGANAAVALSSTVLSTNTLYRIEAAVASSATAANCSAEIRIYVADSSTPIETIGPAGALSGWVAGGPMSHYRIGVGAAVSPVAPFSVFLDDIGTSTTAWLGSAGSGPAPAVDHVWIGGLTANSVVVAAGVRNIASARLVVSTNSGLTSPVFSSSVAPSANGAIKLTRASLTANTQYFFGIEADGSVLAAPAGRGSFTTDPAEGAQSSFSVAFGSCQQTNSNSTTFQTIADKTGPFGKARRVLHLGDLHYRDFTTGTTATDIDGQYKTSLATPRMQAMASTIAMPYLWDDHDWGGAFSNASAPAASLLAAAYRSWVPSYTLPATDGKGIWQSWVIGRVRFIALDTRSQRSAFDAADGPSKTLLGAEQKAWLYARLAESEPVKIILCGFYWRQDALLGDRWGSYANEFQAVNDQIVTSGAQCFTVFGDRHALAADNGSTSGTRGMAQAGGAPFHQTSTPSGETWSHGYYDTGGASMEAFGWLDITDSGSSITVAYSGITSADGTTRVSMSKVFPVVAAPPLPSGSGARWGIHI